MTRNILKELNETAMKMDNERIREALKSYAVVIRNCIICLKEDANYELMQELVGAWTRADRLLETIKRNTPSGSGGAMPIPKAKAA